MSLAPMPWPEHGGPDGGPAILHDFSTNANPLPLPEPLVNALAATDRRRYPDPHYGRLCERLAAHHGLPAHRVLPTAGSSEAIRRLTLLAHLQGLGEAWVPAPGYGDYAAAAYALGLKVHGWPAPATLLEALDRAHHPALVWLNEPCNPTGVSLPHSFWQSLAEIAWAKGHWLVLDRAYEPLRLEGRDPILPGMAARAWQLWSPNKALGLTGIRAGYVLAPTEAAEGLGQRLRALAPSWVLSAEGEQMLLAWWGEAVQAWLQHSRRTLEQWRTMQRNLLGDLGWAQRATVTPFWLARPPLPARLLELRLRQLRSAGLKLRDASSFGLPGWVRVSTQSPDAQAALALVWHDSRWKGEEGEGA